MARGRHAAWMWGWWERMADAVLHLEMFRLLVVPQGGRFVWRPACTARACPCMMPKKEVRGHLSPPYLHSWVLYIAAANAVRIEAPLCCKSRCAWVAALLVTVCMYLGVRWAIELLGCGPSCVELLGSPCPGGRGGIAPGGGIAGRQAARHVLPAPLRLGAAVTGCRQWPNPTWATVTLLLAATLRCNLHALEQSGAMQLPA